MHSVFCTRVLLLILSQQKLRGPDAKPPPEFSSLFSTLTNEKNIVANNDIDLQDLSASRSPHANLRTSREHGMSTEEGWRLEHSRV